MNRLKSAMFAVLVTGSAVALVAQGEATGKAEPSSKSGKTAATVTGCVATGTQAEHYVLTNAVVTPSATPAAIGTSGAPAGVATTMAIEPTTSYALKGGDLKAHVGHKVEVTGTTWQHAAMHDAKATTAPTTAGTDTASALSAPGATLEVKSVRMLSTTCP